MAEHTYNCTPYIRPGLHNRFSALSDHLNPLNPIFSLPTEKELPKVTVPLPVEMLETSRNISFALQFLDVVATVAPVWAILVR